MLNRLFMAFLILLSGAVMAIGYSPSTPNELSEIFKTAHETRNYDEISSLVNWDGVRKPMRKKIEVYTKATFGLKIDSIIVEEVADSDFQQHKIGSKEVKPNMPVSHIMKVHFDKGEEFSKDHMNDTVIYLLGKNDNDENYRIAVYVSTNNSSSHHHH